MEELWREINQEGIIEPEAGGGFQFPLFVEGLTQKVTFEKRFERYEEASHVFWGLGWGEEHSKQRKQQDNIFPPFFLLFSAGHKSPLMTGLLRKLFQFFTSASMYNIA